MFDPVVLRPDETRFIEEMGLHFESLGAPRIGGRLFGLLMVAPRPLLLDEIAELLLVSRASVSTNTRLFIQVGIVEPHAEPGDRRRYYVIAENAWEHRLHVVRAQAAELDRLVVMARAAIGPENAAAAERLGVAGAFAGFLREEAAGMMERWPLVHANVAR